MEGLGILFICSFSHFHLLAQTYCSLLPFLLNLLSENFFVGFLVRRVNKKFNCPNLFDRLVDFLRTYLLVAAFIIDMKRLIYYNYLTLKRWG